MDKYRIDSHKLYLHPKRVAQWLDGELIYPLYIEISPSGACNHRCSFCAVDFMGYTAQFLPTEALCSRLSEMGKLGVKSVMYGGEGEPLLHPDIAEITLATREAGIDVAFTTNGTLLKQKISDKIIPASAWIKVSCNAGTESTYAQIHRTKESDFSRVFSNLEYAANLKTRQNHACVLGMQTILLPENVDEIGVLAKRARDIGMDYLVIKPYSQHPLSNTNAYASLRYEHLDELEQELADIATERFAVIFRKEAMRTWDSQEKKYSSCLALPFWSYIDASGNVWGCSMFLKDQKMLYGNIIESDFSKIWEGEQRKESLSWCKNTMDASGCRINCRMDSINKYLWELVLPGAHDNFI